MELKGDDLWSKISPTTQNLKLKLIRRKSCFVIRTRRREDSTRAIEIEIFPVYEVRRGKGR
jgi:hypothetical protein